MGTVILSCKKMSKFCGSTRIIGDFFPIGGNSVPLIISVIFALLYLQIRFCIIVTKPVKLRL